MNQLCITTCNFLPAKYPWIKTTLQSIQQNNTNVANHLFQDMYSPLKEYHTTHNLFFTLSTDHEFSPGLIKSKAIKLVSAASPLGAHH